MALPSLELMRTPIFQQAMRDVMRGYRWEWRRIGGGRWRAERKSIEFLPWASLNLLNHHDFHRSPTCPTK